MDVENRWAVTSELTEASVNSEFKERSTGLAIYGSLLIAMGVLAALMVPLMFLSVAFSAPSGGASAAQMIPAAGIYAIMAVTFVTLGIGSIRARRWARALTLVMAWMWLAVGAVSLVSMAFFMPSMSDMMAGQPQQPPPMVMNAMMTMMIVMMVGIYILLPGIFLVFYSRQDVKATCEKRDPQVRWTDHCPLPVLSLSLFLAFGATSILWTAGYGFVVPFFGILLKGVPGALFVLCISALFGYLAWANYKLKLAAWWTTLGSFALLGLSTIITFRLINLIDLYREMGFPEQQLTMMEKSGAFEMNLPVMMSINLVAFAGYLIWLRKYYVLPADAETATAA